MAASLLLALMGWLIPIPITAKEKPKEETKEVIHQEVKEPINEQPHLEKPISKPVSRVDSGRNIPAPETSGLRHYSKEEVKTLIAQYSEQYGIPADLPLRIANCESGFSQFSRNRNSTASGVFQYLASTWKARIQVVSAIFCSLKKTCCGVR